MDELPTNDQVDDISILTLFCGFVKGNVDKAVKIGFIQARHIKYFTLKVRKSYFLRGSQKMVVLGFFKPIFINL